MTSEPSSSTIPPEPGATDHQARTGWTALRFRAWNLLLLVPLVTLITPLFNTATPRLGGLPFFYWFQLVIIPIGVLCTVTVHLMTRSTGEDDSAAGVVAAEDPDAADVDALDRANATDTGSTSS